MADTGTFTGVSPEQSSEASTVPHGEPQSSADTGSRLGSSSQDVRTRDLTPRVFHSWACTGPFFETVLFVFCADRSITQSVVAQGRSSAVDLPVLSQSVQGQSVQSQLVEIELYDPDGNLFNRVQMQASPHGVTGIEWDPFMGSCKWEAGMKHAHVVAHLPPGFAAVSRLLTREAACVLGSPTELTSVARGFFPVLLSKDRFPLLVLVNRSEVEATVRGRLFCGKRTPETVWALPANGARIISVGHEFGDAIALEPDEQVQAYLRLSVRGDYEVSAQFIERMQGPKEGSVFVAVS